MDHQRVNLLVAESFRLNEANKFKRAQTILEEGLAVYPDVQALRLNLVVSLIGLQDWQRAEDVLTPLRECGDLLDHGTLKAVICNQAIIEQNTGREHMAAKRLQQASLRFADDPIVLNNAALAVAKTGDWLTAEQLLHKAVVLRPGCPKIAKALASHYQARGNDEAAIVWYRKVLELDEDSSSTHTDLAFSLLRARQFRKGWLEFEYRPQSWNLDWLQPNWHIGISVEGKSVAVIIDEGIGDALMFAPMLEQLVLCCSRHVIYCDRRLYSLLQRTWPDLCFEWQIIDNRYREMDVRIRLGSLAALFRQKESDFPTQNRHLRINPKRIQYWQNWLDSLGSGPAVGIGWRGGRHDAVAMLRRSVPLKQWTPLLTARQVRWICLQHQPDQDEIVDIEKQLGIRIHQVQGLTDNIDELATLTSLLDGVVSCEQTAVHVAGSVGTRCWVLLSDPPGWRYISRIGDTNQTMIWYESVTLVPRNQWMTWHPCIEALMRL